MSRVDRETEEIGYLTNLRLLLWKESPSCPIPLPYTEGLFVFNVNYKPTDNSSLISSFQVVTKFEANLFYYSEVFDFVSDVIGSSKIVGDPNAERFLVEQVSDYIKSCFRFRPPLIGDVEHPRLVFVLDVSHNVLTSSIHCLTKRVKLVNDDLPHDTHSSISTNATGQVVLNNEMIERREQLDSNVDETTLQLQREQQDLDVNETIELQREQQDSNIDENIQLQEDQPEDLRVLSAYKEITDCLNDDEINEEEFNNVLCLVKKTFDMKQPKSWSLHKNLRQVRPTLEILHGIRGDIEGHKHEVDDYMCTICFERISKEMEAVKIISCKHVFHSQCVFKWLSNTQSCPCCRTTSVTNVYL